MSVHRLTCRVIIAARSANHDSVLTPARGSRLDPQPGDILVVQAVDTAASLSSSTATTTAHVGDGGHAKPGMHNVHA